LHIAGEGCFLFLVAHFERSRFDLNGLVAILRKSLHRIRHALHRALRSGVTAHDQRERKGGVPGATGDPANRGAARRRDHHRFHFVLAALLDEDRVLPGRAAGSGAGGSAAGWAVAPVVSKWSKCITTLPSNVITSPFPVI